MRANEGMLYNVGQTIAVSLFSHCYSLIILMSCHLEKNSDFLMIFVSMPVYGLVMTMLVVTVYSHYITLIEMQSGLGDDFILILFLRCL
jgi:hypothetical protein